MYQDKMIQCRECRKQFLFSAGEQEFFAVKSLANQPKRCPNCRLVLRNKRNGNTVEKIFDTACAKCGAFTKVPFQPRGHSPVFCLACYVEQRSTVVCDAPFVPDSMPAMELTPA
jgi:CxxC-x17-CxxC domain-containing protein